MIGSSTAQNGVGDATSSSSTPSERWRWIESAASTVVTDQMPTGEQLVDSYQTYADVVMQQLKSKQQTQGRTGDVVAAIQHFEAFIFDEAEGLSIDEFMVYWLGSGGRHPLAHIRFDWTTAMPAGSLQPS